MVAAIRETSQRLGNTPAVCRSSYINPAVLSDFAKGRVSDVCLECGEELPEDATLHAAEEALLRLLKAAGRLTARLVLAR
jgi:DNA topoisomerase-1